MKKLFIVVNEDRFLLSHRREIVERAIAEGYAVTVVAKDTGLRENITNLGARFIELPVNPTGTNILQELKTLIFLVKLFKKEQPDIVHNVGLKCILWGGLAARLTDRPLVVNAVSGLGVMFSESELSLYAKLILRVIKFSNMKTKSVYIFQNSEDRDIFISNGVIDEKQCRFTKGSGINLNEYVATHEPEDGKIVILFTGRMVEEKGVIVLIEAANILRDKYQDKVVFRLCGGLSDNPKALTETELTSRCDNNYIEWLGHRTDVKELLQRSHIVAFPSYYREGLPKSLIEACASARPIVTTDSIGCRDCVDDGINGYKVAIKDPVALASKIEILIQDRELRLQMGAKSREFAEQHFSVDVVVRTHLNIYNQVNVY